MGIKHAIKQRIVLQAIRFVVEVLLKKKPLCTIVYDGKDFEAYGGGEGGYQGGVITQHNISHLFEGEFNSAFEKATAGLQFPLNGDLDRNRFYFICKLAKIASARNEDFVFVGVSWGVAPYAVLEYTKSKSKFYFVDKWDGSIPSQGEAKTHHSYCNDVSLVKERFKKFGNVNYITGFVPECLPEISSGRIAFLHLDIGMPEAEMATIEALWPIIVEGGGGNHGYILHGGRKKQIDLS